MSEIFNTIFPHPTLTPLSNTTPTGATLRILHQELNANAIAVPSTRGNGTLGHFALVTPAANYLLIATVPFVAPVHPGNAPVHQQNATGAQITEVNRQFTADGKEHTSYINTEAALKKQLLQAVPATFTQKLSHSELGYANITTLALLTHLDTTYGTIQEEDLERNLTELHKPWQIDQPIETLFHQLTICRTFAADTDPISEATAIRAGLTNLENTSSFTEAIREWRQRPIAERTLANFEIHFAQADIERKRTLTTRSAGYHQAATVQHNIQQKENEQANSATTTSKTAPPPTPIWHYCWSHGLSRNAKHTGHNCERPAPGHRTEATITNMLGGCNTIRRGKGEREVYKKPTPRPTPAPQE